MNGDGGSIWWAPVFCCYYLHLLKATSWPMFWSLVGGGGWHSHMKGAGCSSSRRGVNFGLWCHLGCSRQNAIIFSRKGRFQGCKRRNIKTYIFSIRFIYSIYVIKVFFRGQKRLGHPQLVSFRGLIQNFRRASPPFSYGSPHPGVLITTFAVCTMWLGV